MQQGQATPARASARTFTQLSGARYDPMTPFRRGQLGDPVIHPQMDTVMLEDL
ncbi:hypothetical protein [Streptomyces scopuliridis]|uniref:hypothetical protein n=1 Tax=Streptomyces scopuliridis TaxID=452529 RepID=UPI003687B519